MKEKEWKKEQKIPLLPVEFPEDSVMQKECRAKNGSCFDCKSPQCICCQILTTRFSRVKGRFQIILVDENLGF